MSKICFLNKSKFTWVNTTLFSRSPSYAVNFRLLPVCWKVKYQSFFPTFSLTCDFSRFIFIKIWFYGYVRILRIQAQTELPSCFNMTLDSDRTEIPVTQINQKISIEEWLNNLKARNSITRVLFIQTRNLIHTNRSCNHKQNLTVSSGMI